MGQGAALRPIPTSGWTRCTTRGQPPGQGGWEGEGHEDSGQASGAERPVTQSLRSNAMRLHWSPQCCGRAREGAVNHFRVGIGLLGAQTVGRVGTVGT